MTYAVVTIYADGKRKKETVSDFNEPVGECERCRMGRPVRLTKCLNLLNDPGEKMLCAVCAWALGDSE